jgi:hypothetical protein
LIREAALVFPESRDFPELAGLPMTPEKEAAPTRDGVWGLQSMQDTRQPELAPSDFAALQIIPCQ